MRSPGRPPGWRREHQERFWEGIAGGLSSEDAGVAAGVSPAVGSRWFRENGGMAPFSFVPVSGRYLSFVEREEIAVLHARQCGVREIARRLGRSPSTISRELRRNAATRGGGLEYRATTAQWHSDRRACRPKAAKLAENDAAAPSMSKIVSAVLSPARTASWCQAPGAVGRSPSWAPKGSTVGNIVEPRADLESGSGSISPIMSPCESLTKRSTRRSMCKAGVRLKRELVACLRTGRALRVPKGADPASGAAVRQLPRS